MEVGPYVRGSTRRAEDCIQRATTSTGQRRRRSFGAGRRRWQGGVVGHATTLAVSPCRKVCPSPCQPVNPDIRVPVGYSASPELARVSGRSTRLIRMRRTVPDRIRSGLRSPRWGDPGGMPVRSIPVVTVDTPCRTADPAPWPDRHATASCRFGSVCRSGPGQACFDTSAAASSGSIPATILALILMALTALVAPVWRMMATIRRTIAR